MQDRIQINGVWYVRELEEKEKAITPLYYRGCLYETDDYIWDCVIHEEGEGESAVPFDVEIKFIDKHLEPWKEEHWDHLSWIKGVLENNPDSMSEARLSMNEQGIKDFKKFLKYLVERGWL